MKNRWFTVAGVLTVAGFMLALPACEKKEQPKETATSTAPAPDTGSATAGATTNGAAAGAAAGAATDAVAGKLASADAYDGATDKTVSKCLMCGLRMDGSAEHAQTHAGYTLHFCSADCAKAFAEKPEEAIEKLEVPG